MSPVIVSKFLRLRLCDNKTTDTIIFLRINEKQEENQMGVGDKVNSLKKGGSAQIYFKECNY